MAKQTTIYLPCAKSLTSNYMSDSTIHAMKSLVQIPIEIAEFGFYEFEIHAKFSIITPLSFYLHPSDII